jgi:hypothetical protein
MSGKLQVRDWEPMERRNDGAGNGNADPPPRPRPRPQPASTAGDSLL